MRQVAKAERCPAANAPPRICAVPAEVELPDRKRRHWKCVSVGRRSLSQGNVEPHLASEERRRSTASSGAAISSGWDR